MGKTALKSHMKSKNYKQYQAKTQSQRNLDCFLQSDPKLASIVTAASLQAKKACHPMYLKLTPLMLRYGGV